MFTSAEYIERKQSLGGAVSVEIDVICKFRGTEVPAVHACLGIVWLIM